MWMAPQPQDMSRAQALAGENLAWLERTTHSGASPTKEETFQLFNCTRETVNLPSVWGNRRPIRNPFCRRYKNTCKIKKIFLTTHSCDNRLDKPSRRRRKRFFFDVRHMAVAIRNIIFVYSQIHRLGVILKMRRIWMIRNCFWPEMRENKREKMIHVWNERLLITRYQ